MVAAALIVSMFAPGIEFGWQPMPDQSSRHEVVVQLEPELLPTLTRGQSIPVVCEVPADAQPVGRIRIVVGRGDLPHEGLVTRRKPAAESTGIALTQYTESGASRYSAPAGGFDPYTQAPPTAAAATNAASGSGWNGGAAAEVADAAASMGPLDRVGAGIQQMTEPLRDGVNSLDNQLRAAADNFSDKTQNLLDRHLPNRPALVIPRGESAPPVGAEAPAAGWNGGGAESEAPGWNGGQAAETAAVAPPAADEPRGSWNDDVAASTVPPTGVGATTPPSVGAGSAAPQFPEAPPLVTGPASPVRGADNDPWANVEDKRLRTGATDASATRGGAQPTMPEFPPAQSSTGVATAGQSGPSNPLADSDSGQPAITSGMLNEPPWRPLDGVDPSASAIVSPSTGASPFFTTTSGTGIPAAAANATTMSASDTSASGGLRPPAGQDAGHQTAPGSDARNKAAVILAWVLLSGSAAGNIYLFWSYLDVRTKYRALVRKTARAVGSRFSAA